MRTLLLLISLLVLAGCTTVPTGPRVQYDRKYNEYRYLRGHVPEIRGAQAAAQPAVAASDESMARMQDHMQRMQQQMDRIRQTEDPQERQKLMQEHMQAMQEHAQAMGDMRGCMMMGMMDGQQMQQMMAPPAAR